MKRKLLLVCSVTLVIFWVQLLGHFMCLFSPAMASVLSQLPQGLLQPSLCPDNWLCNWNIIWLM